MITERTPSDWRDLQDQVSRILRECGMQAEVERSVRLVRGTAEVDVVAVETIEGRTNIIFCECKHWVSSIPQGIVHAFRTVVADGGANVGYIVTSSAFQRGALTAADSTNLRLVTWLEFQSAFESTWIDRHLRPLVTERLDKLMTLTEPLLPRRFQDLSMERKAEYLEARERYSVLGALAMPFTSFAKMMWAEAPSLPLRGRLPETDLTSLPDSILDATGYREFLDAFIPFGEAAAEELSAILRSTDDSHTAG